MGDVHNKHKIPTEVDEIVDFYLSLAQTDSRIALDGLYLVGSLALGDYITGVSDIDFVATLAKPLNEQGLTAIKEIHKKVRDFKSLNLRGRIPNFDGFYIEKKDLRSPPRDSKTAPFSFDGSVHVGEICFEANPVTWEILRLKAIAAHGPTLNENQVYRNEAELLKFSYDNLKSYWIPWVESARNHLNQRAGQDVNAETITWGVLGVSRIGHLLESESVSSKTEAGHWAQIYFPKWKSIIGKACDWRRDQSKKKVSYDEAIEAINYIEECLFRLSDRHRTLNEIDQ